MLQYFLHNSNLTPGQPHYGEAIEHALKDVGAGWSTLEEVKLADGTEIAVLFDADDDIALIEATVLNDAVCEALLAIMDGTDSFLLAGDDDGSNAFRLPGSEAVEPLGAMTFWPITELESRDELKKMLFEGYEAYQQQHQQQPTIRPTSRAPGAQTPRRSLARWLSDTLFGRAI